MSRKALTELEVDHALEDLKGFYDDTEIKKKLCFCFYLVKTSFIFLLSDLFAL